MINSKKFHNLFFTILIILVPILYIFNSSFDFDDLSLFGSFSRLTNELGFRKSVGTIFFGLDLGGEYRTYGASRVLEYFLWLLAWENQYIFSAFISISIVLSGLGIYLILNKLDINSNQAFYISLSLIFSPFIVTTCFHHYSYLILPYQLIIIFI